VDYFFPSGFMAEVGDLPGISVDEDGCPVEHVQAGDVCWKMSFTPQGPGVSELAPAWAGVYWLQGDGQASWKLPGVAVEPGATKIVFTAWAASEAGQRVKFQGGVDSETGDGYALAFESVDLTATPTEYELAVLNPNYTQIVGPFAWAIEGATDNSERTFYVKNVRLVK
jgi:hypothetical protein